MSGDLGFWKIGVST